MNLTESIQVFNTDCMNYMEGLEDNAFELAIVDPPYGVDINNQSQGKGGGVAKKNNYAVKDWDKYSPDKDYFNELIRVSVNQVVWGANHFISKIPIDSSCWIVWDKQNGLSDFADAELAWTSFETAVRLRKWKWAGMLQGDMKNKEQRIHPTQKPVKLYEWILKNYANEGDKILDTHLGSGSSAIACHNYGYEFVGCELDEDYFNDMVKRFKQVTSQTTLF